MKSYPKIKAVFTFKQTFNYYVQKGDKAVIDAVRGHWSSRSHFEFRVVNIWKRPVWFDAGWFEGFP